MRKLDLINKCVTGEISGEEYKKLYEQLPWLKPNVELAKSERENETIEIPKILKKSKRGEE